MAYGAPAAEDFSAGEDGARGGLWAALGGLTTRGRSFLAAGAAAAACSYVLGQEDLLRVGLLLALLPLVCVLVLYATRHRVTGSRLLTPGRVPASAEAHVGLRVQNVSRLPTGLLMLQDRVPYLLGPRPRFVLDRIEPGGHREVSYTVRADLRGRYALGPLQLRLTDPFGMCELTRGFGAQDTLTVVPRVDPLPAVRLGGQGAGEGDGRLRSLALAGEDDIIPRGYRQGDDLRRVHWRSTARHGRLMVRREEQPRRSRATVLLDTRALAYAGAGPGSPFEWAVSGAASVTAHLLGRGFATRVVTDAGPLTASHSPSDALDPVLEDLAVLDHSFNDTLAGAQQALAAAPEGLLVAFFGDLDEHQALLASRMRPRGGTAIAFLLDGPAWMGAPPGAWAAAAAARLREAGWTALPVPPGVALPDLWRWAAAPEGTMTPGAAGRVAEPAAGVPGDGVVR
ncbi:membrane protein [Streptomyces mashuensis]|uniref:Membrane protein n=1 Tax=Streptomyces mashuensis TaxID=33904 RepID=A0A919B064_9ACTN|nr:DUF58 domain-containing protein [Streptomyces mashuensis]GHF31797.1 membrane protein [Streptomyces mashuensis]